MPVDLKLNARIAAMTKRKLTGYATAVEDFIVKFFRSSDTEIGTAALLDSVAGIPVGGTLWHAGSTIPDGFLLADGRAVSRTDYSALFQATGTTHGQGDGLNTFNIINLMGAAAVGSGGTRVAGPLTAKGSRFETDEVTLAVANLPRHRHEKGTLKTDVNKAHRHSTGGAGAAGTGRGGSGLQRTGSAGAHTHVLSGNLADSGGTDPIDLRQPWVKMLPLVYTGVVS